MLKDYIIAELMQVARSMVDGTFTPEDMEEGVDIETPCFTMTIKVDLGTCIECEYHKPILGESRCDECNEGRMSMFEMERDY